MRDRDGVRVLELFGLALASLSVLGSQIAMSRILSLKFAANQTFLVVSFAVLGLAVGAAVAHRWGASGRSPRVLPAAGMLVFSVALALLGASFYLNLSTTQQIVLVPLPFVGVGICIAAVFAQRSARAGLYYAVDLAGAALGAFGAAPLLDRLAAPTALLLFVALGALSAVAFLPGSRPLTRGAGLVAAGVVGAVLLVTGFPFASGYRIPIYPDRIKDMLVVLEQFPGSSVESSRWSALGRTDIVDDSATNRRKVVFLDGAAGSYMYADPAKLGDRWRVMFENGFGPSVALRLTPAEAKRTALTIGSGGGRDVVACRFGGIDRITAVELNGDIVDLVLEQSEFNGRIYDGDDVDVAVEEGRHFLRGSDRTWDVIMLSIPVTKRGESYGGFALSESYIFTQESMGEYLDHLTEPGQLLIVCHTRQEVGRLVNTYLETMRSRGVTPTEAMSRLAVYGRQLITVVITGASRPADFWSRLERETRRLQLAAPSQRFYFMPGEGGGKGSPELVAVASGASPAIVFPRASTSTFEPDMSPVTDDRPFFYFFTESLPPLVSVVLGASGLVLLLLLAWGQLGRGGGDDADADADADTRGRPGVAETVLWRLTIAGLGVAFMLVEVPLIQRFVFWFGRPTLALGLLLGTLLLATGVGALLAGLLVRGRLTRAWPVVAGLGAFFVLAFLPLQNVVFAGATGGFTDSLARSLVITVPVGLAMGVPFPTLLTAAGRRGDVSVALLWGINGVGSVLGSAAAVAIAMMLGYSYAMMLAGLVYVATAVAMLLLARRGGEAEVTPCAAGETHRGGPRRSDSRSRCPAERTCSACRAE